MVVLGALIAALAGCAGAGDEGAQPTTTGEAPAAGAPAPGGGLSVEEALGSKLAEPILVEGSLLADGMRVRLCSGFRESHPPQCVEPALRLRNLDLASVEGLRHHGAVAWSDEPVQLLGTVRGDVLTVEGTAKA